MSSLTISKVEMAQKAARPIIAGADFAPSGQHFFHFHLRLLSSGALACRIKKFKRVYFLPTAVLVTGLLDQNAATVSHWITGCK
jgi:hypothetical protein